MYFYVAYHVSCSALLGITTYIYIYILSAILLLLYTTVYLHKCASLHKMHIACLIQLHRETRHVWCFVSLGYCLWLTLWAARYIIVQLEKLLHTGIYTYTIVLAPPAFVMLRCWGLSYSFITAGVKYLSYWRESEVKLRTSVNN